MIASVSHMYKILKHFSRATVMWIFKTCSLCSLLKNFIYFWMSVLLVARTNNLLIFDIRFWSWIVISSKCCCCKLLFSSASCSCNWNCCVWSWSWLLYLCSSWPMVASYLFLEKCYVACCWCDFKRLRFWSHASNSATCSSQKKATRKERFRSTEGRDWCKETEEKNIRNRFCSGHDAGNLQCSHFIVLTIYMRLFIM